MLGVAGSMRHGRRRPRGRRAIHRPGTRACTNGHPAMTGGRLPTFCAKARDTLRPIMCTIAT
jgi:hypothetical protein